MVGEYSNGIDQRLAINGGLSPVKITGSLEINGSVATITAHYELVDPGSFTVHQGTLFIFEHDVTWCCGYGGQDQWDEVVRMVRSQPVSLTTVGQIVTITENFNLTGFNPPINPANLHPLALFEEIGGSKQVLQAADFVPLDYVFSFPVKVGSVPTGNGETFFSGTITNIGEVSDVVSMSIVESGGWTVAFQAEGDPNYYQSHDVALAIGESKDITVRVQTDGVKRVGTVELTGESSNTGHVTDVPLRVFNNAPALLFVDDDGAAYEAPFVNGLNGLGYLYDTVSSATASSMTGYDAVIWHTAYANSTPLTNDDLDAMASYLDAGGRLYLSSMDGLTGITQPNAFVTDYLGVASWTVNTRSSRAEGVGGDPITDGMSMALSWPGSSANRVDTIQPVQDAAIIFHSDTGNPAAVRYESGPFRTVFNTIAQNAFPTAGADPNNNETVIERTLLWLLQSDPTSVDPMDLPASAAGLWTAPNPARGAAEIGFGLRANAGDIRLVVVDASGRLVRELVHGKMDAGSHQVTWDLKDAGGSPVPTGVYFAKLQTATGESSGKVVVVR